VNATGGRRVRYERALPWWARALTLLAGFVTAIVLGLALGFSVTYALLQAAAITCMLGVIHVATDIRVRRYVARKKQQTQDEA